MSTQKNSFNPSSLGITATGRTVSCFAEDFDAARRAQFKDLAGKRVLVVGGAGTIGGEVSRLLAGYPLAALHIVDLNENSLVEHTRTLRSSGSPVLARDVRWIPLDFGAPTMVRLVISEQPYDHILNFAAVKHVRSEKDLFSILHLLNVNVIAHHKLLVALADRRRASSYFSVSTDKAANPVNLMGASKRMMENVMFSSALMAGGGVRSARFANVAFSDGSLLLGWTHRLAKRQPLAVPGATKRFFVTVEESGHLCMLAAFATSTGSVLVPRMTAEKDLVLLEEVAEKFLNSFGFRARKYQDEAAAIANVESDAATGNYPLLVTSLDTSGEKPYEEFAGASETLQEAGFKNLMVVLSDSTRDSVKISQVVDAIARFIENPILPVEKHDLVKLLQSVVPDFVHSETGKKLDDRI